MGFGTLGDLNQYRGPNKPSGLPQWLLDQFKPTTSVDEGGSQSTTYSLNDNPYGGFLRDGKYYVQVGANKLKDPAKTTTDPELGDITEVSNVLDPVVPTGPEWWMPAMVIGAGLLGPALGLGAEAATSGGAAALTGTGLDESLGLAGTGTYTGAAPGAFESGLGWNGANPLDPFGPTPGNPLGLDAYGPPAPADPWNMEPGFEPPTNPYSPATDASGLPHGGDNPYGTEIPNEYTPGSDPTKFYEPLGKSSWMDRILQGAKAFGSVASAIKPGTASAAGRAGGAGSGASSGSSGGPGRGGGGLNVNTPNVNRSRADTQVGTLGQYLRGHQQ